MLRRITLFCTFAVAAAGCNRRASTVAPPSASVETAAPSAAVAAADAPRVPGQGAAEAGLDLRAPIVYVDGAPRAALTYNELPAALKLGTAGRAVLCDYLHEIGVECAAVRQIDLHGPGGSVVSVAPAELRVRGARALTFHFIDANAGKPLVERKGALVPVEDMAIFVHDKPAPAGARYAHDDGRRGVRVDVDGLLVGKIKRNLLEGNVEPIAEPPAGGMARYRLTDYLASKSVEIDHIRGIDLVLRDERVVRLAPAELADGLEFAAPDKGHGEMLFFFGNHTVKALAVVVWAKSEPPVRAMRAPVLHALLTPTP